MMHKVVIFVSAKRKMMRQKNKSAKKFGQNKKKYYFCIDFIQYPLFPFAKH